MVSVADVAVTVCPGAVVVTVVATVVAEVLMAVVVTVVLAVVVAVVADVDVTVWVVDEVIVVLAVVVTVVVLASAAARSDRPRAIMVADKARPALPVAPPDTRVSIFELPAESAPIVGPTHIAAPTLISCRSLPVSLSRNLM